MGKEDELHEPSRTSRDAQDHGSVEQDHDLPTAEDVEQWLRDIKRVWTREELKQFLDELDELPRRHLELVLQADTRPPQPQFR